MALSKILLGFDPLLRCAARLQIKDLLNIQPANVVDFDCQDLYQVGEHICFKFQIIGYIVRVDKKQQRQSYVLDDGTGVITCTIWINQPNELDRKFAAINDLPTSLMEHKKELLDKEETFRQEGYCLGDVLSIRGRLTEFSGQREIYVLDHHQIKNPNTMSKYMLDLQPIYKSYKRKVQIPKTAAKELTASTDQNGCKISCLQAEIQSYLKVNTSLSSVFSISEILSWPCVTGIYNNASNSNSKDRADICLNVRKVLTALSNTGLICRLSSKTDHYEIIRPTSSVLNKALDVLKSCYKSDRNPENGCNIKQIFECLNKNPLYHNLTLAGMQNILNILEERGDVISLSNQCYLPML